MSFSELGLSEAVLRAVGETGYVTPTPIQAQAIPVILMGRDVLGCAQTGTGKTAGFTLPMIDILASGRSKARMPRSLILEPTRELAAQVAESFGVYGKYTRLTKALLIGGESFTDQEKALDRGVDVLVATPGRLLDLFERGKILLRDVKVLVIDEADRMLDMGFIPDVERIVSLLPPLRQTLFFSATMPPEIRRLADRFLSAPKEITVARPATTAANIEDFVVPVREREKREALRHLLRNETIKTALIFCNRKRDVDVLFRSLYRHGFNAGALHGDMPQDRRNETLAKFRRGELTILVASDVAARGLDIDDISHVFNFDVPYNPEDYVHRIGRTGRAGRSGRAFTLATADDDKGVDAIHRVIRRKVDVMSLAGFGSGGGGERDDDRDSRGRDDDRRGRRDERSGRGGRSRGGRGRGRRGDDRAPARDGRAREDDRRNGTPRDFDRPAPAESRRNLERDSERDIGRESGRGPDRRSESRSERSERSGRGGERRRESAPDRAPGFATDRAPDRAPRRPADRPTGRDDDQRRGRDDRRGRDERRGRDRRSEPDRRPEPDRHRERDGGFGDEVPDFLRRR
jgi:superfamily II DNA/RNA helicase